VTAFALFPNLRTSAAPRGIVSLQLAWRRTRSDEIVSSWQTAQLLGAAKRSLVTDEFFLLAYGAFFVLTGVLLGRAAAASGLLSAQNGTRLSWLLAGVGVLIAILDAVENVGLWLQLNRRNRWTLPTSLVSSAKWALAALLLLTDIGLVAPILIASAS
jgi:hypothetical protein